MTNETLCYCITKQPLSVADQRTVALILLDHALTRTYGVTAEQLGGFAYGEHGKPYFRDCSIRFNYSHCKYGAVCAVAEHELGVDIQNIPEKVIKPSLIKRVCCANEEMRVRSADDFIRIWVQKEAYAKFTGRGFAVGMRNVDTTTFPPSRVRKIGNVYIAVYADE